VAHKLELTDGLTTSNAFDDLIPSTKGPDNLSVLGICRLNPLQHIVIDLVTLLVMILEVAKN